MLGLPSVQLRGILSLERNQRKSGVEGHYEYPGGEQTKGSGLELHWHNSCRRREVDKAVREVHGDSRMWTGQGGG